MHSSVEWFAFVDVVMLACVSVFVCVWRQTKPFRFRIHQRKFISAKFRLHPEWNALILCSSFGFYYFEPVFLLGCHKPDVKRGWIVVGVVGGGSRWENDIAQFSRRFRLNCILWLWFQRKRRKMRRRKEVLCPPSINTIGGFILGAWTIQRHEPFNGMNHPLAFHSKAMR